MPLSYASGFPAIGLSKLCQKWLVPYSGKLLAMVVIVMGVTGSGKTTVGQMLAEQLGWHFADADSFHSQENIGKMRRGVALDDSDRGPWLASLRAAIANWIAQKQGAVLACSSLKRKYRDQLRGGKQVRFAYLQGSRQLIADRLRLRVGHFANDSILADQFADLEEPDEKEGDIITVSIEQPVPEIVEEIRRQLGLA
jgi:gluconokinase